MTRRRRIFLAGVVAAAWLVRDARADTPANPAEGARAAASTQAAPPEAPRTDAPKADANTNTRREGGPRVQTSAELSTYADTNHVTVVTPTVRAGVRDDVAGYSANARYLVDVVSAASVDIVATASPRWTEARHAVAVDGQYGPGDLKIGGSGSVSVEPDYLSLGGGVQTSLALDRDHVNLAAGYAFGHDTIGRAKTPFDVFHRTLVRHGINAGASFVLGPSSIFWLGGDVVLERGDQSKPYRYVPLFDAATARRLPNGASVALVQGTRLDERPLEQLPLARDRFAVTARYLHRSSWATLRIEERLYTDTWGQYASTTDVRYAMDLSPRLSFAPDVRFHKQTAASFWERGYVAGFDGGRLMVPSLRTGDRELGPLWSLTVGAQLRVPWGASFGSSQGAVVLRVAGIHTEFEDTLFILRRDGVFTAIGFEGSFDGLFAPSVRASDAR